MRRIKLLLIGLVAALLSALLAWSASAAPLQNPPPAIWCPGPGGVMALCSPVPTPTWRAPDQRRINGYFFAWRKP